MIIAFVEVYYCCQFLPCYANVLVEVKRCVLQLGIKEEIPIVSEHSVIKCDCTVCCNWNLYTIFLYYNAKQEIQMFL
jgi:hypothetical protein